MTTPKVKLYMGPVEVITSIQCRRILCNKTTEAEILRNAIRIAGNE